MILIDTNVLVYAVNVDAAHHAHSRAFVDACMDQRISGVIVPQVLTEFYAVVTSLGRVPNPLSPMEAWAQVEALRAALPLLNVHTGIIEELGRLVETMEFTGARIFDLFLVAQMRTHGIDTICTHNAGDFRPVQAIRAVPPEAFLTACAVPI